KVVCVGRNYVEHVRELRNEIPEEPLLFIKPGSSVVSFDDGIKIPRQLGSVHHEAEIAVLIGNKLALNSVEKHILPAIVGLAPALDLTLRDLQTRLKEKGHPWEAAKAFDGACVLAHFEYVIPDDLTHTIISLSVNDQLKQEGNSAQMLFPIVSLIQHITKYFSLQPGDVVLTGTPQGVGPLVQGDKLQLSLNNTLGFISHVY
ncbi:UNVERIFIED_CONTAM: hypothetical protein GTU68_039037, partial [Idotea baltica]|nr:hypothetical protein [Idotea baltica]